VDCRQFIELISAAVDGRLPDTTRTAFHRHAEQCSACSRAFELERLTKQLVHARLKRIKVPGEVASGILERLDGHRSPSFHPPVPGRIRSRPRSYAITAAATLLAGVALFLLRDVGDRTRFDLALEGHQNKDIITQSRENYRAVLAGMIEAEAMSLRPQDLRDFFEGKTDFPVVVPAIRSASSVGGLLNQCSGRTLAHLIYTHQRGPIYVYEVCWKTVRAGDPLLCLPSRIAAELVRVGRYVDTLPNGTTSYLWTHGATLCVAISSMPREEFLLLFATETTSNFPR
jgi:anti-sigma factor (TIGR02949 family)